MSKLSKMDFGYEELMSVNVFRIAKINAISMVENIVSSRYLGDRADSLQRYSLVCEFLMPFDKERGIHCKVNKDQYNNMDFETKRSHVYKIKANVFGFLNCLANESSQRREKNL